MIDTKIVDCMQASGVDIILSLPCNMLSGILTELTQRPFMHIPVCREEEGIGIAAGAALAGKRPMLLMQNSGLGNSLNALLSLTQLYRLPLFLMMSLRGGPGELIPAQIPMGKAAPLLLTQLDIEWMTVTSVADLINLELCIKKTYAGCTIGAAFLSREIWHEAT